MRQIKIIGIILAVVLLWAISAHITWEFVWMNSRPTTCSRE